MKCSKKEFKFQQKKSKTKTIAMNETKKKYHENSKKNDQETCCSQNSSNCEVKECVIERS